MGLTCGSVDEQREHMVVVSLSCGDSMPFLFRPKITRYRNDPECDAFVARLGCRSANFETRRDECYKKQLANAVCLHDGDLLLMLGGVHKYFEHSIATVEEWTSGKLREENYRIIRTPNDPEPQCSSPFLRINITGRLVRHHLKHCPLRNRPVLQVLPAYLGGKRIVHRQATLAIAEEFPPAPAVKHGR